MKPVKFIVLMLVAFIVLSAAAYWPVITQLGPESIPYVYVAAFLSLLSCIISYLVIYNGITKDIKLFLSFLVAGMIIKLVTGIVGIMVVATTAKSFITEFVVSYFLGYLIFTSFEVFGLIRNLRPKIKKSKQETDEYQGVKGNSSD